jgi:hypothetical protein
MKNKPLPTFEAFVSEDYIKQETGKAADSIGGTLETVRQAV